MPKKHDLQLKRRDKIRKKKHRIILTITWPEYIIRKVWRYQTFIFYSNKKPKRNPSVIQRLMAKKRFRRRKTCKPKKSLKIRKQRAVLESMQLKNRRPIKSLRYKEYDPYASEVAARISRRRTEFDKKRKFL
ncbi:uncharacterized protein LOC112905578 [Agrilus planipennis]|uniref:Uncharacterized protein LOC112905578 n=1 Tax=Agrilus planipennis TaxID=224129 RepID=A0A7F5RDJ2_AGRPL|nr:uncharacterized protein LOC112905578 [Agrilus planipennis]